MMKLPQHLITDEILTRLPVKSFLRFKSVSKQWYSTISSGDFSWSHLQRYITSNTFIPMQCYLASFHPTDEDPPLFLDNFAVQEDNTEDLIRIWGSVDGLNEEPDSVRSTFNHMVGSCNGLVCFADRDYHSFRIWNPCTDKCHTLEHSPLTWHDHAVIRICSGFGYVWSEDTYKIVLVVVMIHGDDLAYVYSLRANEWNQIPISLRRYELDRIGGRGVLVNEKLHWIEDISDHCYSEDVGIMVFDLEVEEFEMVLGPSYLLSWTYPTSEFQLCAVNGFLGVHSTTRIDVVWILVESEWVEYFFTHLEDMSHQGSWVVVIGIDEGNILFYGTFDKEIFLDAICYVESLESPFSTAREAQE